MKPIRDPGSTTFNDHYGTRSIIKVRASVLSRGRCTACCRCNCHMPYLYGSPKALNRVLGVLFVGYCGKPFGTVNKCSVLSCQIQPRFQVRLTYTFPLWFVYQALLDFSFVSGYGTEPHFSLTVRGLYTSSSDLWTFTFRDDGNGLRRLFGFGGARPNDLSVWSGMSALQVSFFQ